MRTMIVSRRCVPTFTIGTHQNTVLRLKRIQTNRTTGWLLTLERWGILLLHVRIDGTDYGGGGFDIDRYVVDGTIHTLVGGILSPCARHRGS